MNQEETFEDFVNSLPEEMRKDFDELNEEELHAMKKLHEALLSIKDTIKPSN